MLQGDPPEQLIRFPKNRSYNPGDQLGHQVSSADAPVGVSRVIDESAGAVRRTMQ